VKEEQNHVVISLVFKIGPQKAISMERARRMLSLDMAVCGTVLKFDEKTTCSRYPKMFPKQEFFSSVKTVTFKQEKNS